MYMVSVIYMYDEISPVICTVYTLHEAQENR